MFEFLPPYSPDFNPIKESFSALKAWIRRHRELVDSFEDFGKFLILGVEEFMEGKDARGYFRSAGGMFRGRNFGCNFGLGAISA